MSSLLRWMVKQIQKARSDPRNVRTARGRDEDYGRECASAAQSAPPAANRVEGEMSEWLKEHAWKARRASDVVAPITSTDLWRNDDSGAGFAVNFGLARAGHHDPCESASRVRASSARVKNSRSSGQDCQCIYRAVVDVHIW